MERPDSQHIDVVDFAETDFILQTAFIPNMHMKRSLVSEHSDSPALVLHQTQHVQYPVCVCVCLGPVGAWWGW